jgi:hypothetical protein
MLHSLILVNSTPRPLPLEGISALGDIIAEPKGVREKDCHNRERRRGRISHDHAFRRAKPSRIVDCVVCIFRWRVVSYYHTRK